MSELEPSLPSHPGNKKTEREGLPPGYRMRADAHYVDQLSGRRIDTDAPRAVVKRSVESPEVKDVREARDHGSDHLVTQLLQEMDAVLASSSLLTGNGPTLGQRANIAAVRAHAFRAAWLLRAHTLVEGTHRAQVRPRSLGRMLDHVRDGLAAEFSLTGARLEVHANDWSAQVSIDDVAMAAGVSAAIFASLAMLPDAAGATIRITASAAGHDLRAIEITQDESAVAANVSTLFFDPAWSDRPGGGAAATAAACVKAVANLHGGDAILMPAARRGSTIRLNFHRTN